MHPAQLDTAPRTVVLVAACCGWLDAGRHHVVHETQIRKLSMTPNQTALLQFGLAVGAICLVGYGGLLAFEASNKRFQAERAVAAEQDAAELALEKAQTEVLDELARGKTDVVDGLIDACGRMIMEGSKPIYTVIPERKDPSEIEKLMRKTNPNGYEKQIAYIGLPSLDEQEFLSRVGNATLERKWETGEVSLQFAVTFDSDSISGLNSDVWGYVRCPLRGGQPSEPTLEALRLD